MQTINMSIGFRPLMFSILLFLTVSALADSLFNSNMLEETYKKNYEGDAIGYSATVSEQQHLMSDEKFVTLMFATQEMKIFSDTGPYYLLILRYQKPSNTVKMYVSNGLHYKNSLFGKKKVALKYRFDKENALSVKGTVNNVESTLTDTPPSFIEIALTDRGLDGILSKIIKADRFTFTIDGKGGTILTTLPKFKNTFDFATHAVENFQYRIGKIENDPIPKHDLALDIHSMTERVTWLEGGTENLDRNRSGPSRWYESKLTEMEDATKEIQLELEDLREKATDLSGSDSAIQELQERATTFLQELTHLRNQNEILRMQELEESRIQNEIRSMSNALEWLEYQKKTYAGFYILNTKNYGRTKGEKSSKLPGWEDRTKEFQKELRAFKEEEDGMSDEAKGDLNNLQERTKTLLQEFEDVKVEGMTERFRELEKRKEKVADRTYRSKFWLNQISENDSATKEYQKELTDFTEEEEGLSEKAKNNIEELQQQSETLLHELAVLNLQVELELLEERRRIWSNSNGTKAKEKLSEVEDEIKQLQKELDELREKESAST